MYQSIVFYRNFEYFFLNVSNVQVYTYHVIVSKLRKIKIKNINVRMIYLVTIYDGPGPKSLKAHFASSLSSFQCYLMLYSRTKGDI